MLLRNLLRVTAQEMNGSSSTQYKPPPPCESPEQRRERVLRAARKIRSVPGWDRPDPDELERRTER